jgi:hypothetical protein
MKLRARSTVSKASARHHHLQVDSSLVQSAAHRALHHALQHDSIMHVYRVHILTRSPAYPDPDPQPTVTPMRQMTHDTYASLEATYTHVNTAHSLIAAQHKQCQCCPCA